MAQTVTTGLVSPRDKAIALNDWVRKNIRYVAVYVGPGGVVPHSVETILANRYGDCKDHVAILEALLNAQNAYTLPKVPTLGVFNHVMTYIPSLDLFLDSTAQSVAGGYLPLSSLGKPVLFSKSGEMGRTPVSQESKTETTTVFQVKSSGDADFSQTSKITGWAAELNRYVTDSLRAADRDLLVTRILASSGQKGKGEFKVEQPGSSTDQFSMSLFGQSENMVSFPGPTGVPTLSIQLQTPQRGMHAPGLP